MEPMQLPSASSETSLLEELATLCAEWQLYLFQEGLVAPSCLPTVAVEAMEARPAQPSAARSAAPAPPSGAAAGEKKLQSPAAQEVASHKPAVALQPPLSPAVAPTPVRRVVPPLPASSAVAAAAQVTVPSMTTAARFGFELTAVELPPSEDEPSLLALLSKKAPHLKLLPAPQEPPRDKLQAPVPRQKAKAPILLLGVRSSPTEKIFLQKLAHAISFCLGKEAQFLVLEEQLPPALEGSCRLLIVSAHRLEGHPLQEATMPYPADGSLLAYEGRPLLLLPDVSLLIRQGQLKAKLWRSICQLVARYVR